MPAGGLQVPVREKVGGGGGGKGTKAIILVCALDHHFSVWMLPSDPVPA